MENNDNGANSPWLPGCWDYQGGGRALSITLQTSSSVSDMRLKFKKHQNSSAINRNKERAGAARKVQTISQQDRELILFHKKDSELSASLLHFTGIKVLLSTLSTAAQRRNLILLHRGFVDKTDKKL